MTVSLTPFIWYARDAEEAARFYASVIPNSSVGPVTVMAAGSLSGPPGSVVTVEFTLAGMPMMAMAAGPHHDFNDAISLMLVCDTQAEVDHLWTGLLQGGGKELACGWLQDRYGVRWQITPRVLLEMLGDKDRVKSARASQAMMQMVKLDIAALQKAFDGS